MEKVTEEKKENRKTVKAKIRESLLNELKEEAKKFGLSISGYVSFMLSRITKKKILFEEKINRYEHRKVKSRVALTESEIEMLKSYAIANEWSLAKELRYRIVSTLAKKPKLSKEELKAVYCVRSAINLLGANLNQLIRSNQLTSSHHTDICQELSVLIKDLINKIDYLEKCSNTSFKLK